MEQTPPGQGSHRGILATVRWGFGGRGHQTRESTIGHWSQSTRWVGRELRLATQTAEILERSTKARRQGEQLHCSLAFKQADKRAWGRDPEA
jgi:hypothetical protein